MRFRRCLALLCIIPLLVGSLRAADADRAEPPTRSARLILAGGDYATGRLVDASQPNRIAWQCDVATEPFEFPLAGISAVYFPQPVEAAIGGDFFVELTAGDLLVGSIAALTADAIVVQSPSLGSVRVDRHEVRRVFRTQRGQTRYYGPNGLTSWIAAQADNRWRDEAGQLSTERPGSLALANCIIPSRVNIDLEVSWQKKAEFSIHVGGEWQKLPNVLDKLGEMLLNGQQVVAESKEGSTPLFSLEVWGDSLVLVRETVDAADVAPVQQLSAGPGRLHLRLFFDRTSGRAVVYSAEGKLLAEVNVADNASQHSGGLRLENKSGDLRVEYLAVYDWLGDDPVAIEPGRSFLQRTNDEIVYADSFSYDPQSRELVVAGVQSSASARQDASLRIPLAEMAALVLQPDKPSADAQRPCSLRAALYDGTRLSGELDQIVDERLYLRRPGVEAEIELPIARLRLLASLRSKPSPPDKLPGRIGRLEAEGVKLRGSLVGDAAEADVDVVAPGASCLRWLPIGAETSSSLVAGVSGRIIYREPPPKSANVQPPPPVVRPQVQPQGVFAILNAFGKAARVDQPTPSPPAGGDTHRQLLWLRGGDRIPCTMQTIDDRGVVFESTVVEATFLPHDAVKAWERQGGRPLPTLDAKKLERLLTLPRMQRNNPPTHLIESRNGDFLRGCLEEMTPASLFINVRLETKRIAVDEIAAIIWFEPAPRIKPNGGSANEMEAAKAREEKPNEKGQAEATESASSAVARLQALRSDGVRLTFEPRRVVDGAVSGRSELLGDCRVELTAVDQFLLGDAIDNAAEETAYGHWRLQAAADPHFVQEANDSGGGPSSTETGGGLVGKPAPDFRLELLAGGEFRLSQQRGQVVVLDFWASWCGPCMQSMPKLERLAHEFEDRNVSFVAVNMQEDRQTAADALERLKIEPATALDVDGAAAERFAVSAIPQTVVIDRQGDVAAVLIGGGPDFEQRLRETITAALDKP